MISVVIILALIAFTLTDSFFISPSRFVTRRESLSSEKIPEQLDNMNILFFSDLDYGTYMDEERLNTLVEKINQSGADVIIFGGDIYDIDATITEESNQILISAFSSLKAKYGKFAVYGDSDRNSEVVKTAVDTIFSQSNFEIIENASYPIHKNGSQFITIVGIDNGVNGTIDIESSYANVSSDSYVIAVCHTPDSVNLVPSDLTDYFLAGHSLGGQVYYVFSALYQPACANQYFRGKHTIDESFTLDITNGTGTIMHDVRFLSDAEIVLYTLHSESTKEKEAPSSSLEITQDPLATEEPSIEDTTNEEIIPEETTDTSFEETPVEDTTSEEIIPEENTDISLEETTTVENSN